MIWYYLIPAMIGIIASSICILANYFDWKTAQRRMTLDSRFYSLLDRQRAVSASARCLKASVIFFAGSLLWPVVPFYGIYWLFKSWSGIAHLVNKHIEGDFE